MGETFCFKYAASSVPPHSPEPSSQPKQSTSTDNGSANVVPLKKHIWISNFIGCTWSRGARYKLSTEHLSPRGDVKMEINIFSLHVFHEFWISTGMAILSEKNFGIPPKEKAKHMESFGQKGATVLLMCLAPVSLATTSKRKRTSTTHHLASRQQNQKRPA